MTDTQKASLVTILAILGLLVISVQAFAVPKHMAQSPEVTPSGEAPRIATEAELIAAQTAWANTAHADTYDNGMGANTTCARCKSPTNWDPSQSLAQEETLDCNSCKRVPGALRPELESGVDVSEENWMDISCEVCHMPAGDSFYTEIAFWDQTTGQYQEVESVMELCAYCHEGQHGFEVVEEQEASPVHVGMTCVDCHGSHGTPSACEDCHDPTEGAGAVQHARHTSVNCTACHDAGNLSVWYDNEIASAHFGEYITRRYAHTLTSWPSHNLQVEVTCERCHHPQGRFLSVIANDVSCTACHEDGAVIFWCENFPRDLNPYEDEVIYP